MEKNFSHLLDKCCVFGYDVIDLLSFGKGGRRTFSLSDSGDIGFGSTWNLRVLLDCGGGFASGFSKMVSSFAKLCIFARYCKNIKVNTSVA